MILLLQYTLIFASVLLLVALGGCFSEHSGVINIGLEGIMVMGALGGALMMKFLPESTPAFGMILLVVLAAIALGVVYSLLLAVAAVNFKAQSVANREEQYLVSGDPLEAVDRLCAVIRSFIARQNLPKEKILAIGVSISGRVHPDTGYSYSYFFVEEQPLVMLLEERLGYTVYIEHDTRAATYGEYMSGVGNSEKTMLYINASWGLGLGMILDGKLFYGKSGFSGEYGHFPMFDNEVICRCGKRGCLETGASGSAVHRIFLERLGEGRISMLSDKFRGGEAISLDDILSAVLKEDVLAIEIMESVGHTLGKALAGLINMFNPELIVLGGTLAATRDYLMLPVKSAINKYSLRMVSKDTEIKFSKLGESAGVVGASLLARSKLLHLL